MCGVTPCNGSSITRSTTTNKPSAAKSSLAGLPKVNTTVHTSTTTKTTPSKVASGGLPNLVNSPIKGAQKVTFHKNKK